MKGISKLSLRSALVGSFCIILLGLLAYPESDSLGSGDDETTSEEEVLESEDDAEEPIPGNLYDPRIPNLCEVLDKDGQWRVFDLNQPCACPPLTHGNKICISERAPKKCPGGRGDVIGYPWTSPDKCNPPRADYWLFSDGSWGAELEQPCGFPSSDPDGNPTCEDQSYNEAVSCKAISKEQDIQRRAEEAREQGRIGPPALRWRPTGVEPIEVFDPAQQYRCEPDQETPLACVLTDQYDLDPRGNDYDIYQDYSHPRISVPTCQQPIVDDRGRDYRGIPGDNHPICQWLKIAIEETDDPRTLMEHLTEFCDGRHCTYSTSNEDDDSQLEPILYGSCIPKLNGDILRQPREDPPNGPVTE